MRRLATPFAAAVLIGAAFHRHRLRRISSGDDAARGDLRSGTIGLFTDAPEGRMAVGMKADVSHDLLFVAGGFTGKATSTIFGLARTWLCFSSLIQARRSP